MTTAPQRTASAWDAFYADWVEPVLRFGTPALVVFVLLLVLVRVLTRVVVGVADESLSQGWDGAYWVGVAGLAVAAVDAAVTLPLSFDSADSYDAAVQAMLWITIGLFVLCGVLLVVLFAQPTRTRDTAVYGGAVFAAFVLVGLAVYFPGQWHEPIAVVTWALVLAAAAAVVAARVRGLHIGLVIQARNKDGADDAGLGEFVRVRLHALGSQPPRGIDLSQSTDVSSLPDGALSLLPDGTLAKLGAVLVQLFQPATPWRAVVCEQADSSISVVMIRNGKVADTTVIRRSTLNLPAGLGDATVALRTAAAAFVLLELSERHVQLRRGLGGATDWRSVAAQVIGTDPAVTSTDVKVELLTNAVAFDGGNLAAYAGLIALGYRRQGTDLDYDARLVDLLDRIAARADRHDDLVAIRLRTLFNLSVIRLNRAITHPDLAPTALVAADASATRLAALLDDVRDRRELTQLVAEIGTATWLLRESIHALDSGFDPPEGDEPTAAMSLLAYYERACLRMLEGRVDAALDDLFLATRGVQMRTAARTDRSFAELHDQQAASPEHARRFKMLVGDPVPADLFDLIPVKRHRKALERNGIRTADQLGLATVHRLVDEVGLGPGEARMLQELAMLFGIVKDAGLLFVLLRLGLATRADLRRRLASGADLRTELIAAARDCAVVAPTDRTIALWRAEAQ